MDTGELVYQTRLAEGGLVRASPVAADGRLYFASRDGRGATCCAPAKEFELLATERDGRGGHGHARAISDGLLVVRTLGHVVGIGDKPGR